MLDSQIGDAGNFTEVIPSNSAAAVPEPAGRETGLLPVANGPKREHHHLGTPRLRADSDRLRALVVEQHLEPGDRILIQSAGQAGLVFALAPNLLCPSPITGRKTFFELLLAAHNHKVTGRTLFHHIDPLLNKEPCSTGPCSTS